MIRNELLPGITGGRAQHIHHAGFGSWGSVVGFAADVTHVQQNESATSRGVRGFAGTPGGAAARSSYSPLSNYDDETIHARAGSPLTMPGGWPAECGETYVAPTTPEVGAIQTTFGGIPATMRGEWGFYTLFYGEMTHPGGGTRGSYAALGGGEIRAAGDGSTLDASAISNRWRIVSCSVAAGYLTSQATMNCIAQLQVSWEGQAPLTLYGHPTYRDTLGSYRWAGGGGGPNPFTGRSLAATGANLTSPFTARASSRWGGTGGAGVLVHAMVAPC